jgi:hypothetical protein
MTKAAPLIEELKIIKSENHLASQVMALINSSCIR